MAQAKSGFSTEGTQYATDSSYYLLDTVPGSGSVIEGPVTVTNNLTVTGSETVQGALGVAGNITAPGVYALPGAAAPLALVGSTTASGGVKIGLPFGATGAVSVEGGGANFLSLPANGDIKLITSAVPGTVADHITISNAGVGTLAQLNGLDISGGNVNLVGGRGGTGQLRLNSVGNLGISIVNSFGDFFAGNDNPNGSMTLASTGGPFSIIGSVSTADPIQIGSYNSVNGVSLTSGLSVTGAVGAVVPIGTGTTMLTNKGFFSTTQTICIVVFPFSLSSGNHGIALVQGIQGSTFSPISVVQNGTSVILSFVPGNTQSFSIVVL